MSELSDYSLIVTQGLTTPSRPGRAPRPVWTVTGNVFGLEDAMRGLGGHQYRGEWSFWDDPTAGVLAAAEAGRATYAEQVIAKRERAEDRVERYTEYAGNATERAGAAFARADRISERFAGGQPIICGHHSEAGARADQRRIHNAMDRGLEEQGKATYLAGRAAAAERTAWEETDPAFIARRIQDAETELRVLGRQIDQATRTEQSTRLATLEALKAEQVDKLVYWHGQLAALGAPVFSRENVKVGDYVKQGQTWYPVIRVNPKSVTVKTGWAWYTPTIRYGEISEVKPA